MFDDLLRSRMNGGIDLIRHHASAAPAAIPPGHVGPVALPGTGRMVWWTGRVAIGLRHQPERRVEGPSQSALWIQALLLDTCGGPAAARPLP
jgi:hypothetical protein